MNKFIIGVAHSIGSIIAIIALIFNQPLNRVGIGYGLGFSLPVIPA